MSRLQTSLLKSQLHINAQSPNSIAEVPTPHQCPESEHHCWSPNTTSMSRVRTSLLKSQHHIDVQSPNIIAEVPTPHQCPESEHHCWSPNTTSMSRVRTSSPKSVQHHRGPESEHLRQSPFNTTEVQCTIINAESQKPKLYTALTPTQWLNY